MVQTRRTTPNCAQSNNEIEPKLPAPERSSIAQRSARDVGSIQRRPAAPLGPERKRRRSSEGGDRDVVKELKSQRSTIKQLRQDKKAQDVQMEALKKTVDDFTLRLQRLENTDKELEMSQAKEDNYMLERIQGLNMRVDSLTKVNKELESAICELQKADLAHNEARDELMSRQQVESEENERRNGQFDTLQEAYRVGMARLNTRVSGNFQNFAGMQFDVKRIEAAQKQAVEKNEHRDGQFDLMKAHKSDIARLDKRLSDNFQNVQGMQEDLKRIEEAQHSAEKQEASIKAACDPLKEELETVMTDLSEMKEHNERIEETLTMETEDVKARIEELHALGTALPRQLETLQQRVADMTNAAELLKKEQRLNFSDIRDEMKAETQKRAQVNERVSGLRVEMVTSMANDAELLKEELRLNFSDIRNEMAADTQERGQANQKISDLQAKTEKIHDELSAKLKETKVKEATTEKELKSLQVKINSLMNVIILGLQGRAEVIEKELEKRKEQQEGLAKGAAELGDGLKSVNDRFRSNVKHTHEKMSRLELELRAQSNCREADNEQLKAWAAKVDNTVDTLDELESSVQGLTGKQEEMLQNIKSQGASLGAALKKELESRQADGNKEMAVENIRKRLVRLESLNVKKEEEEAKAIVTNVAAADGSGNGNVHSEDNKLTLRVEKLEEAFLDMKDMMKEILFDLQVHKRR